jgi:hypothetical protein
LRSCRIGEAAPAGRRDGHDVPASVGGVSLAPDQPVGFERIEHGHEDVGGEFEIEAAALADHRELGMTWSPMGILRAPSKLIIRGRLVRAADAR